jgi:hypothetical protein
VPSALGEASGTFVPTSPVWLSSVWLSFGSAVSARRLAGAVGGNRNAAGHPYRAHYGHVRRNHGVRGHANAGSIEQFQIIVTDNGSALDEIHLALN